MKMFWLSFADDNASLGAAVVEANSVADALSQASRRGINPGGEVAAVEVPAEYFDRLRPYRNRLMSRAECERVFGPSMPAEHIYEQGTIVNQEPGL